ncbi:MAG: biotin/lipoyl-containing protein [Candidatus Bipolaricaulota bacterium]
MESLKVPDVGKVETVTVTEWKVGVGDRLEEGGEAAEVETMKTTFPVQSTCGGKVKEIMVEEGQEAEIGDILALLEPTEE